MILPLVTAVSSAGTSITYRYNKMFNQCPNWKKFQFHPDKNIREIICKINTLIPQYPIETKLATEFIFSKNRRG